MRASLPRLAEALAALSLAGDLGMGLPLGHAVRVTNVAGRLAASLGLGTDERWNVFHVSLLHGIGCTADAHDLTRIFGADEIALKAAGAVLDDDDPLESLRFVVTRAGSAGPAVLRPLAIARALALGDAAFRTGLRAHCEVGDLLAARVGVSPVARAGLLATFERWDGKGVNRIAGSDIPAAARVFHVAKLVVAHHDQFGAAAAVAAVRAQTGRALEPSIAEAFLEIASSADWFAPLTEPDVFARTIDFEPAERRMALESDRVTALFEAIADIADLKSPMFVGHSRAVASLAVNAGRRLGLGLVEIVQLNHAALGHDLGRVSVPNRILDKKGPLTIPEWESVRLHPYYTERVLLQSAALAPHAATAGLHHERLDGSGYQRGIRASSMPPAARILAAADVYQALTSVRAHRPAIEHQRAAAIMRGEVRAERLDEDAVEAVLGAAEGSPRRRIGPIGRLSARETEVLVLLAGGMTTRLVAERLGITTKTARHHVEHIYDKLGVSTRASAVVAAIGLGLLGDQPDQRTDA